MDGGNGDLEIIGDECGIKKHIDGLAAMNHRHPNWASLEFTLETVGRFGLRLTTPKDRPRIETIWLDLVSERPVIKVAIRLGEFKYLIDRGVSEIDRKY